MSGIPVSDLERRFKYHPPRGDAARSAHETVRARCGALAERIVEVCPPGRETSLAVTAIEEAMFWANAAIARAGDDR